jgi:hypothetical protein
MRRYYNVASTSIGLHYLTLYPSFNRCNTIGMDDLGFVFRSRRFTIPFIELNTCVQAKIQRLAEYSMHISSAMSSSVQRSHHQPPCDAIVALHILDVNNEQKIQWIIIDDAA